MKNGDKVYSTCGETFNYDQIDFDIGDTYFSGTVVEVSPQSLLSKWTVDTIVEQMEERLYEEVGEASYDALNIPEDKKQELLLIISDFVKENATVSCYKVEDIKEHILTVDDLD